MTKFLIAAAALGLAAPAFAQDSAAKPIAFERDGVHYVATVKTVGNVTIIDGHEVESGKSFTLRAHGTAVSGTYNATPVSYTVAR